jgi:predicted NBD/HSP70 family sugar kinase
MENQPPLGNRDLIRAINRSSVLNTIKRFGSISRTEIARHTGLSAATVTGITAELISDELVFEKAAGDSRGGRRPILLAINPRRGYVVGIKLMEEQALGAITDLEATIINMHTIKLSDHLLESAIGILLDLVRTLIIEARITKEKLLGVGIGLAGIVDAKRGTLRNSPIFGWRNVPLVDLLSSSLNVPIYIDNDVNTLTLTEQLFGAGQGVANFLTITIGRGVGLGIVVNGRLYRGANGGSGEFGHTVIEPDGPKCACGKNGCLETYVSDPGILRIAFDKVAQGKLPGDINSIETLLQLAQGGDPEASSIFQNAGERLGQGIANLINVFSPNEIIISGEGVRAGDLIFNPMRESIERYTMPGLDQDTEIRIDVWEDIAWARGAASLVLQELFKSPFHHEKVSDIA